MTKYSYRTRTSTSGGYIVCMDYAGEEFESLRARTKIGAKLKGEWLIRWYRFIDWLKFIW